MILFDFSVVLELLGKEWQAHYLNFPCGVSLEESHTGLETTFLGELLMKALSQQTTNSGDKLCFWAPSADRLKDEVKMRQKHYWQQSLNVNKHISPINNAKYLVLSCTSSMSNSKPAFLAHSNDKYWEQTNMYVVLEDQRNNFTTKKGIRLFSYLKTPEAIFTWSNIVTVASVCHLASVA